MKRISILTVAGVFKRSADNKHEQAMVWSAVNGVGLALVIPCIQSLIADYNPPERRGSAFGTLFFISSMGEHAVQMRSHASALPLHR